MEQIDTGSRAEPSLDVWGELADGSSALNKEWTIKKRAHPKVDPLCF
ncbi:hypothetical protein [Pseudomonas chlororaphis]|nr:hypothetical protein [Pseudomonas chlororaphis]MBP5065502.1 hypothetical protein [Pseudomonas chlororaphis]QTT93853.1 hypothetical protein HUT27_10345 [Pseudomonas chlororaphis]